MSLDTKSNPSSAGLPGPRVKADVAKLAKLPGLIAISLYMILLAAVMVVRVVTGLAHPILLIFAVFFITGAMGMLLLLRWAWALTLAAVALAAGSFLWSFTTEHIFTSLVQGLLNLVFFLYLVRTDVREKLH